MYSILITDHHFGYKQKKCSKHLLFYLTEESKIKFYGVYRLVSNWFFIIK